jgi:hypothetical protein
MGCVVGGVGEAVRVGSLWALFRAFVFSFYVFFCILFLYLKTLQAFNKI